MIFLSNFRIEAFLKKNAPFNSLKNVHTETKQWSWDLGVPNTPYISKFSLIYHIKINFKKLNIPKKT